MDACGGESNPQHVLLRRDVLGGGDAFQVTHVAKGGKLNILEKTISLKAPAMLVTFDLSRDEKREKQQSGQRGREERVHIATVYGGRVYGCC